MTKDEALRLALDALEEISHVNTYQNEDDEVGMKVCCDQVSYQPHSTNCQTMKAITAIKQALEQPEHEWVRGECMKCGVSMEQSEHQPKADIATLPEPMAWTDMAFARLGMVRDKMRPDDVATVQRFLDGDYTAQPKREPLTDEQKEILNFLLGSSGIDDFWFGDKHPTEKGKFWWRDRLRKAFQESAHGIKGEA